MFTARLDIIYARNQLIIATLGDLSLLWPKFKSYICSNELVSVFFLRWIERETPGKTRQLDRQLDGCVTCSCFWSHPSKEISTSML